MGGKIPAECPECGDYSITVRQRPPEADDESRWITYIDCEACETTVDFE